MPNLKTVRKFLEARRLEVTERHERVRRHTRYREEPLPADFAEQAVELENGETLIALDQRLEAELKNIDRALARIDSGDYAYCQNCGAEIGDTRLEALPVTVLCIDCANDRTVSGN